MEFEFLLCLCCFKRVDADKYEKHIKDHHSKGTPLSCNECFEFVRKRKYIPNHLACFRREATRTDCLVCTVCSYKCASVCQLTRHHGWCHKSLPCFVCSAKLVGYIGQKMHAETSYCDASSLKFGHPTRINDENLPKRDASAIRLGSPDVHRFVELKQEVDQSLEDSIKLVEDFTKVKRLSSTSDDVPLVKIAKVTSLKTPIIDKSPKMPQNIFAIANSQHCSVKNSASPSVVVRQHEQKDTTKKSPMSSDSSVHEASVKCLPRKISSANTARTAQWQQQEAKQSSSSSSERSDEESSASKSKRQNSSSIKVISTPQQQQQEAQPPSSSKHPSASSSSSSDSDSSHEGHFVAPKTSRQKIYSMNSISTSSISAQANRSSANLKELKSSTSRIPSLGRQSQGGDKSSSSSSDSSSNESVDKRPSANSRLRTSPSANDVISLDLDDSQMIETTNHAVASLSSRGHHKHTAQPQIIEHSSCESSDNEKLATHSKIPAISLRKRMPTVAVKSGSAASFLSISANADFSPATSATTTSRPKEKPANKIPATKPSNYVYVCHLCQKEFQAKGTVKVHLQTVHNIRHDLVEEFYSKHEKLDDVFAAPERAKFIGNITNKSQSKIGPSRSQRPVCQECVMKNEKIVKMEKLLRKFMEKTAEIQNVIGKDVYNENV